MARPSGSFQYLIDANARAGLFIFNLLRYIFFFCFNTILICSKVFSEFNATFVYLFAVYVTNTVKFQLSKITFSTLFPATNLLRCPEFLVRMYGSIFNWQHNF